MLRGVGAAVGFLLAMQALPAQAQSGDLPICRSSYSKAWERVSGGNDLVAMDRAIAAIPVNNCPNLHAEASSIRAKAAARIEAARVAEVRRVESERRAAEEAQRAADAAAAKSAQAARDKDAAQARELKRVRDEEAAKAAKAARDREATQARELKRVRDEEAAKAAQAARDREAAQAKELERIKKEADGKAWLVAKEADTIASYAGYLTAYPNGEYAGLAKQARERLGNVRLSVCNNSTDEKVFVSLVYQPVGASSMQGKGWYDVERGKCRELFTTATRTFYVRRSAVDGRIWEGAGTQTYSFCAGNSAFDYTWSGNCPTDVPAAAYYRYTIPAGVASYNANLVDSPQRAADVAAWDLARRTDSILAYDSYLGTHPNGLYASNARSARKALLPLRVSVCNKSGREVAVARVFLEVGQTENWRYSGWQRIANDQCALVLETRNSHFSLRAQAVDGSGMYWTGKTETREHCVVEPGPFSFTKAGSQAKCPSDSIVKTFKAFDVAIADETYTWTLNP